MDDRRETPYGASPFPKEQNNAATNSMTGTVIVYIYIKFKPTTGKQIGNGFEECKKQPVTPKN